MIYWILDKIGKVTYMFFYDHKKSYEKDLKGFKESNVHKVISTGSTHYKKVRVP